MEEKEEVVQESESGIQMINEEEFWMDDHYFRLVENYKDGFNAEALWKRYSDILLHYDYIVGDWGYEQLRLKGFYAADNYHAPKDDRIDVLEDYLYEYCNYGCAYFVIERLSGEPGYYKSRKKRSNNAYIYEKTTKNMKKKPKYHLKEID